MCYNVQQKATIKELTEQFNAQFKMPALYQPKDIINGFESPLLPVLKSDSPEVFEFLNWGLIPHWAKTEDIRRSEEHTSELQSRPHLVCRLLLEKKKKKKKK